MRRNAFFWGSIFILFGLLWMLRNAGIITFNVWDVFWPLFLMLLGIWILVGPLLGRKLSTGELVSVPLEGAARARVRINHGAGRMNIKGEPLAGNLLSGTFTHGLRVNSELEAGQLNVNLRSPEVFLPWIWGPGDAMDWTFILSNAIPLSLRFSTGASQSTIDLTELLVTDVVLETGVSETRLVMPAHAGMTTARVQSGVASVYVTIPPGVSARIAVQSGLAGVNINRDRFPRQKHGYQSPDYETSTNKIDLRIETGLGSVDVK